MATATPARLRPAAPGGSRRATEGRARRYRRTRQARAADREEPAVTTTPEAPAPAETQAGEPSVNMDIASAIGSSSSRAGLGYMEEDSAGQQNVFSVEPKIYVQGSATDEVRGGGSLVYSAVALVGSGALVVAALQGLGAGSPTEAVPTGRPLSEYLKAFGEETSTPYFGMPEAVVAPAPVEAPAPAAEPLGEGEGAL